MTQDAVQRSKSPQQWTFTKYDAQSRVVLTEVYSDNLNGGQANTNFRVYFQGIFNTAAPYETRDYTNNATGYTNNAAPQGSIANYLTINYYDNYTSIPGLPTGYSAPSGASSMTTGLPTASLTNVLGTTDMLWNVNYYDDLGRVTTTYKQHYLGGTANTSNYDLVNNTYNFTNQVTATTRQHYTAASGLALTVANTYTYDHMGRKQQTWEQINGGTNVLLSQVDYNEVGQAMTKHLHSENSGGSYLQNVAYNYNERGWLRTGNSSLLNLQLKYNYGSLPQYNGNIAEMSYTAPNSNKTFDYTYDPLNRLTLSNAGTGNALNEAIAYDNMGNITSMARNGQSYGTLGYAYTGNQLTGVTGPGFTTHSYGYDGNGNATSDGVSKAINYNMLNLPQSLTQGGNTIATYVYDADGTKLRTTSLADSTWDYINGIAYRNGSIAYVATEEGRAINESGNYVYQYDLKDHLGNNRVAFDKNPSTGAARELQEDEYYAFGLRNNLFGSNNANRYLYNGKEIQTDLTNQYDYGARLYDPVIGRWSSVDPMADDFEHASPYNYALNNPILMIDPDGMAADSTKKTDQSPLKVLKEVTIKSTVHKTALPGLLYNEIGLNDPTRLRLQDDINKMLSKYTEIGQVAVVVSNVLDWGTHVKLSKTGTPRKKTAKQLKKEWESATGKKWPKEPGNPDKDQVVHHIKALADGGEDGYPNIEPKPSREHIDDHMLNGDFKRWGSKRP